MIYAFCSSIACLLAAAAHVKAQTIYAFVATLVNIALSVVLVQRWGVSGAIAGTVIAYSSSSASSHRSTRRCRAASTPTFAAKILGKYDTVYYRCGSCGFMQTEEPHWLKESYASAINEIDLGPVSRAISGAKLIEGLILSSFDKDASFIDYGAGYGLLVRLMRDRGFDFCWRDLHCENLFAKHFVAKPVMKFELLTAFEVFEHLDDPLSEIQTVRTSDNLLFSTLLVPERVQIASDWWYFGPEHEDCGLAQPAERRW
jgi:hypothetical protein